MASVNMFMNKSCGSLYCPPNFLCVENKSRCSPCEDYCVSSSDYFDMSMCELQCQGNMSIVCVTISGNGDTAVGRGGDGRARNGDKNSIFFFINDDSSTNVRSKSFSPSHPSYLPTHSILTTLFNFTIFK